MRFKLCFFVFYFSKVAPEPLAIFCFSSLFLLISEEVYRSRFHSTRGLPGCAVAHSIRLICLAWTEVVVDSIVRISIQLWFCQPWQLLSICFVFTSILVFFQVKFTFQKIWPPFMALQQCPCHPLHAWVKKENFDRLIKFQLENYC